VLGLLIPAGPDKKKKKLNVETYEAKRVEGFANITSVYLPLRQLVAVLEWVTENIVDGETKTFSYAYDRRSFSLD
jgi:hypothetical protein